MSQSPNTMNFLPDDYVEKREAARSAVIFVGLLLAVVVGIVGTYLFKKWQAEAVFIRQAQVDARFDEAEKKIKEANDIDHQKGVMIAKAELATTLMERVPRNVLLRQLTELQPPSVHMVSVELTTNEIKNTAPATPMSDLEKAKRQQDGLSPEPPKPPEREVTIDLVSTAPSDAEVAKYVEALGKCKLLTDVNLLFSEEFKTGKDDGERKIRKFHVQMKIDPAADLREIEKTASM